MLAKKIPPNSLIAYKTHGFKLIYHFKKEFHVKMPVASDAEVWDVVV